MRDEDVGQTLRRQYQEAREARINAEIISITFTSGKCYYCDDPWVFKLEVKLVDSETLLLNGKIVDIYACQECRDTKFKKFEDRVHVVRVRDV